MIGLTFRLCRQHFGLTVREAAADMGVTEKTVRNWEQSETDIPASGESYVRKQAGDVSYCMKFFRKIGGRGANFIVVCASLEDIHFFYPQISVQNVSYAAYRFGVMHAAIRSGKDLASISVAAYKKWLEETGRGDGLASRDAYVMSCALRGAGPEKEAGPPKGTRLMQCSLLEMPS